MVNYKEAREYLDSFVNYEKSISFSYQKSLKLRRVKFLFRRLGISYQKLKVIHIAGTKGKGSTACFCAYLLASCGYKVGLYTSPHFFDFRERIKMLTKRKSQITNHLISKKDVIKIIEEFKPCLEKLRITSELGKLTFFEVYTAIAFRYFIAQDVDFVVLETGLGGRLDATNVIKPLISIITHIGYDHTDKLGKKLSQIASEKAGIIKRNIPVISSSQRKVVYQVIRKKSALMKAKLYIEGRDFFADNIKIKRSHTLFNFNFNNFKLNNLKIFLKGYSQVKNASCALAAILLLREKRLIKEEINFEEGLRNVEFSGRFEVVSQNPLVIMDVAHNPSSFSVLRDNLQIYFPRKKIILVFAASKDKDVKRMLNEINFSYLILTRFPNPRAFSPWEIKEKVSSRTVFVRYDTKESLELARKLYKDGYLILIAGSFFLVSEAKRII